MPTQQQTTSQSHRSRQPVVYEYEYDHPTYEQAQYAGTSGHRYQYHDQHHPAAAHDEYYSRQYAYANQPGYAPDPAAAGGYVQHSAGTTDAAYYDRHHRYQQHQYDYQQVAADRSDAIRSPSAQVQQQQGRHKYSSQAATPQYDYAAQAERVGSRDADPQRATAAEAAAYRSQGRSDAYEQTSGRAHDHAYNLDTHLSRQQSKSHAYRYGTSEAPGYAYEHAGSAEAAQAHYHQRSPVPATYAAGADYRSPSQGSHMQVFRRDAAGYGTTYPDEAEAEAHGRTHRLAGIGIKSLLADSPAAHEVAFDRHRHRNYDTPPGHYGHVYEEVPSGGYPESHAVMSISQLVGGEVGAYRDEGIDNGYAYNRRPSEHAQQALSHEPIIVVSDDDNEAEGVRHALSGPGRSKAEASESDDDSRPLAARPNRAIRPRPGTVEAMPAIAVPKKRRAAATTTARPVRRRKVAGESNTEDAGNGDKRRPGRRARGSKKIELSREYVSDDDDEDDAPLELSTASLNSNGGEFPRDSSGDHDVAVPSGGAVSGAAAAEEDYSVDEHVQAYIHHVKQRTDRAVAKYEEQARRKSQRMHEHVVQRYGPYLRGYFENVGAANDYDMQGQPPPMGYFSPPSRAMSPVMGYGRQYAREGATPESDDSEPLALLAEEGALAQNGFSFLPSLWTRLAVEHVPLAFLHMQANVQVRNANMQKVVELCKRESRRVLGPPAPRTAQLNAMKPMVVVRPPKDLIMRTRRSLREMLGFWKRHEKEERDLRKRAEKEAAERLKQEEDAREARRQARKLNFLITQTELYSTFVGDKLVDAAAKEAAGLGAIDFDDDDEAALVAHARQSAKNALAQQQAQTREFDEAQRRQRDEHASDLAATGDASHDANVAEALDSMNFQDPENMSGADIPQPRMLMCQLKEYQLKGLTWLAHLYEQGINGILADEMGLGKTVQSISLLAYLAETHNIWGPFMVVAPASTLHNWQQELTRFVPEFKVLPYWGTPKDRKVLRKSLWNPSSLSRRDSDFHVLVTSYQLVVQDEAYLNRVNWQYMVLDEAQAIKSSSSARWKTLLGFHCRNRLLLTGTPIQNSMQELWALLHFIMPMLFDSHEEFSEWFSRDIEAHAENRSNLNQHQLQRLHVILKPFMLRRNKRHVQHELGEKIEHLVSCDLTQRQKAMYRGLMSKISVTDLLDRVQNGGSSSSKDEPDENLMNL
ncbi:putative DNA helicase ino80, partial [Coemansia pectinata]